MISFIAANPGLILFLIYITIACLICLGYVLRFVDPDPEDQLTMSEMKFEFFINMYPNTGFFLLLIGSLLWPLFILLPKKDN